MQHSTRVDYDAIADRYDSQPHREKSIDPELTAFVGEREHVLWLLDLACGTGDQLIANRALLPDATMVGVDGSLGMLRQARRRAPDIAWVHADGAQLPFRAESFDFVSCQYAFHHFRDKALVLRSAFRVLRGGRRLVIYNLCPHDCEDWLYYLYFPEALGRDLADFWAPAAIIAEMKTIGFADVTIEREHRRADRDLAAFLEVVRRRDGNSQLLTLSETAYEAGLRSLEREVADNNAPRLRTDHLCFITIHGDKPPS
ncbi:MAG TPA: methyltransferase domain-containing protein [Stellaceae bacterium]|nr:methyltransferase domain-containing protein [Stellaceae bacterium]